MRLFTVLSRCVAGLTKACCQVATMQLGDIRVGLKQLCKGFGWVKQYAEFVGVCRAQMVSQNLM